MEYLIILSQFLGDLLQYTCNAAGFMFSHLSSPLLLLYLI